MREILTLQFGHFANFVGTHFWNSQEAYFIFDESPNVPEPEILHNTLFRAGVTQRGIETYTPRLLLYDLKGSFGTLKKINQLYELTSDESDALWNWRSETHAQMPYPKNEYLQYLEKEEEELVSEETENKMEIETEVRDFKLDETVQYWSDFNRVYYHPKSVNAITQYQFEDETMPFDIFSYGKNAFSTHEMELDSFEENFRFFAEECDAIQGFQVFTNIIDGFGGFACSFLDQLRDEYPKTAIETFGITENRSWAPKEKNTYYKQILNISLSVAKLTELSSLFNPINTPKANQPAWSTFFHPNLDLPYHTSSIISAAIETSTLPFRSRHNFIPMSDLIAQLNWRGNTKLGSLGLALPLPVSNFGDLDINNLSNTENNVIQDLSMTLNGGNHKTTILGQSVVVRGLPNQFEPLTGHNPKDASQITAEIFRHYESLNNGNSSFFSTNVPYPIPNSFPRIFKHLNSNGYVDMSVPDNKISSIHSAPTLSHLTISTKSHDFLHQLVSIIRDLNFNLFPEYEEGLTRDEFIETREILWGFCEAFEGDSS